MTSVAKPAASTGRPRSVRSAIVIALSYVLVLGGVTVGSLLYALYDESKGLDRSTPQVTTDEFLDAALVLRDPDRIALLLCEDWPIQQAIATIGAPNQANVVPSWGDFETEVTGQRARVRVRVVFRIPVGDGYHQDAESWTLDLENDDGWLVCGLSKETSLDP